MSPAAGGPGGLAMATASAAAPTAAAAPRTARLRATALRAAVNLIGVGLFYVVVIVYFTSRTSHFLSAANLADIAAVAAPIGIVAVGQTVAIVSGGFDLSVGGVLPLGAVVFGSVSSSSVVLATLLAVLVGAAAGTANGMVIERLGINPFICTLATLSIVGGAAYVVTNGITKSLSPALGFWGNPALGQVQYAVFAFAALALVMAMVLRYTKFGRSVYAIGGSREAAELAGLRCRMIAVTVYALSGACAGLAGAITASQLLAAAPNVGASSALDSVAAVIVGGAALGGGSGGIGGTVLGVLLLGTITNGLSILQVPTYHQMIWTGTILLLAVGMSRLRQLILARELKSRGAAAVREPQQ